MRINSFIKVHGWNILSFLLVTIAAALGADSAFAMAAVTVTNAPVEKVADSKGDETQMPGEGASYTEAVESGFTPEEIDQAISEFQAYQTPVEACISALAEKVNVEGYEITHYRTATPIFSIKTEAVATADGTGMDQEITIPYATLGGKQARLLYECKTLFVPGVQGYKADGVTPSGMLALYVLENNRSTSNVRVRVQNPASATATSIPAQSTILIGAVAASESQMIVSPDNFEPVPSILYLQKRIFNVVMTEEWLKGKKKIKFAEEDMRKGALYSYKVNNEITDLLGFKSKFKVEVGNQMQDEYVYTAEGILRQVNMYYSYEDGNLKATDLTAISKMQFTKFSANQEAQVFCGQDFIEGLLNMDLTIHKEIKFEDVAYEGLTVKGWKNNFGALNFIYTPVFDLIGMSKCALVVDLKNARNYIKRAAQTDTVDMKQGVGEVREAKRDIYSQIYAVGLRGYNSMIVGPASQMTSMGAILTNLTINYSAVSALPASGALNTIYYLTAADTAKGFEKGSFVEWENGAYKYYNGQLQTV